MPPEPSAIVEIRKLRPGQKNAFKKIFLFPRQFLVKYHAVFKEKLLVKREWSVPRLHKKQAAAIGVCCKIVSGKFHNYGIFHKNTQNRSSFFYSYARNIPSIVILATVIICATLAKANGHHLGSLGSVCRKIVSGKFHNYGIFHKNTQSRSSFFYRSGSLLPHVI